MIEELQKTTENHMQKAVENLRNEFIKVRTGRANPSILENIKVSCYGTDMPLNQVASISVGDSRTIIVTPFDKNVVQAVEKAIIQSEFGLNPVTAGQVIRVPLPPMTEERRKDLVKGIKNEAENSRITIRNIRRDSNTQLKDALKEKTISENEERVAIEKIQKITDKYISEIDHILSEKESDLMEI